MFTDRARERRLLKLTRGNRMHQSRLQRADSNAERTISVMSLSHQSAFNSPAPGSTVTGPYYGSYGHYPDFYAAEHLDFSHPQFQADHHHAGYLPAAASYGMLTALQGSASGAPWYEHAGLEPLESSAAFQRFDGAGSTAFRRVQTCSAPNGDVKPSGGGQGRSACRELNADVDVSFSI